ncbi:MAG TPA: isoprenylcysteine carboxylmethyltransferase family protein [Tepidisphaeraceae bacterium]|jgi:protein-S-isoprenylcysteine O-methyltransferase Ste14|nr:isoprenylcysteine carboxylmethyltransferase family protein [Tepidisphaeraceae bacterium]
MRAFVMIAVFESVLAALLFGCAGRVDLPWFWALLGIHTVVMAVNVWVMDPELRKERMTFKRPAGADRSIRAFLLPFLLAHLAVAGLDARFGWTGPVALWIHVVGMIGYVAGVGLSVWAMAVNKFFAPVVRLSSERGHHVINTGPYRFVRHPGYLGFAFALFSEAFMLGSYWALLPMVGGLLVIMKRTLVEDRFLHEKLAGYSEYARGVRWRLARGVW